MNEIQLDYLRRRLAVAGLSQDGKYKGNFAELNGDKAHGNANQQLKESEAILIIKQLQDKVLLVNALVFIFFGPCYIALVLH
jgi:hypothetical protein